MAAIGAIAALKQRRKRKKKREQKEEEKESQQITKRIFGFLKFARGFFISRTDRDKHGQLGESYSFEYLVFGIVFYI